MIGVLVKGCIELPGSLSSQRLFFHSSLYLPYSFSLSLTESEPGAEHSLPCPSLKTARLLSSLHLYTLIIGHHLPDLSLTSPPPTHTHTHPTPLASPSTLPSHSPLAPWLTRQPQLPFLSQSHICPLQPCFFPHCNTSVLRPSYVNKLFVLN